MRRTIASYRPQHDEDCDSRRCTVMGNHPGRLPCTCGLEALLSVVPPLEQEEGKALTRSDQPQPGRCDADPRGDDRG